MQLTEIVNIPAADKEGSKRCRIISDTDKVIIENWKQTESDEGECLPESSVQFSPAPVTSGCGAEHSKRVVLSCGELQVNK